MKVNQIMRGCKTMRRDFKGWRKQRREGGKISFRQALTWYIDLEIMDDELRSKLGFDDYDFFQTRPIGFCGRKYGIEPYYSRVGLQKLLLAGVPVGFPLEHELLYALEKSGGDKTRFDEEIAYLVKIWQDPTPGNGRAIILQLAGSDGWDG